VRLLVDAVDVRRGAAPGEWLVAWRVANSGRAAAAITAAWLPHGQFRAPERTFEPPLVVAARSAIELELAVRCAEPSGATVENAFVILRVQAQGTLWRVLTRLTIHVGAGRLAVRRQRTTLQRVGFSA
jgi:hypothetical protein